MIRFSVFLLCLFLFSCSNDGSIPKDVLPENKMGAVFWDIMRADEMMNYYQQRDSSYISSKRTAFYDTIFSIHQISKEDFQRSIQFYQSRPDLLKPILDSLQKKADLKNALPVVQ